MTLREGSCIPKLHHKPIKDNLYCIVKKEIYNISIYSFIMYNPYIKSHYTSWKFPVPSDADVERKATPIKVPKVAPMVLVMKLRGDATKTPTLITIDPSKWFMPYTSKIKNEVAANTIISNY